jgi:5-formyltetrahydrofolate cyclo-ligase
MTPESKSTSAAISHQKALLRLALRGKLQALSQLLRVEASARACALLRRQKHWNTALAVLFYAPAGHELDIWPLLTEALALGKLVALPQFDAKIGQYIACRIRDPAQDVNPGRFGIQEPASHCVPFPISRLDFILVPGLAFDLHGRRLGRGNGFYDLLLTAVRGFTCGVAFDEQIVHDIPVEPHDIRLNCILTPTRWIRL